jgi:hypothetical protein
LGFSEEELFIRHQFLTGGIISAADVRGVEPRDQREFGDEAALFSSDQDQHFFCEDNLG